MTKKDIEKIEEELGYELIFETECQECGDCFQIQDKIPKRVLKKMMETDEGDDAVYDWLGEQAPYTCKACAKDLGTDEGF